MVDIVRVDQDSADADKHEKRIIEKTSRNQYEESSLSHVFFGVDKFPNQLV